jgi:RNA polymerase sigma factor (sigma-70 family)
VPQATPGQIQTPGRPGGPHQARCHHPEDAHCPHHQSAPSTSSTTTGDGTTTLQTTELLHRAEAGDPKAWEEILRRYRGVVFAKVRTFGLQDADVLDAVQMTWLRLAENIHQIQHPERLGGWLATTAARECLHILRQTQRTQTLPEVVVDNLADPAASPEQRVIDTQTAQTLRTLVAKLPPRRRRLLQALFSDHPPSYAELSRAIGIPLGSIGPTRNRALRQLQQLLRNHHQRTPPNQP